MARNKHPEQTVQLILDTASTLFLQKGYDKTTLQDIIDATKLSKGAIYHHFASKDAILIAVVDRMGDFNSAVLSEIRDKKGPTGAEKLRELFRTSIELSFQGKILHILPFLIENPKFMALQMQSILNEAAPHYALPILREGIAGGYETSITEYADGNALLAAVDRDGGADVYFLDIETDAGPDDGIRTARELRRRGDRGLIVYVTGFMEYMQTGYEVKAFRYLLKNQIDRDLGQVLLDIRRELTEEDCFSFQRNKETVCVKLRDILYLESDRRLVHIKCRQGQESFYGSLDKVEEELAEKAGITPQTVSSAELGKKALRPENIIRVCSALDISTDYLLLGETNASDHSILLTKISDLPPIQYRHLEDIINSFILALEEREAQSGK